MKERPIIFGAPMVRALLAGTKTQTRRVVLKRHAYETHYEKQTASEIRRQENEPAILTPEMAASTDAIPCCPYGMPGDRLYVKESWRSWEERCDDGTGSPHGFDTRCGPHCAQTYVAYAATPRRGYRPKPDGATITFLDESTPLGRYHESQTGPWRNSMFMPRALSRITLAITDVRVQRLQEISEEDAEAEGVSAELLGDMLRPLAARARSMPLHWIDSAEADQGDNFCRPCCEKRVAKIPKKYAATVGGGYGSEEDGTRICADCGVLLDCTLTDYAAGEELRHFQEHGIASPDDAFCALAMVENGSCQPGALARVGYRFLWDSINGKRAPWSSNPWVWTISFRVLPSSVDAR